MTDLQSDLAAKDREIAKLREALNEIAMRGIPFRHEQANKAAQWMKDVARNALCPERFNHPTSAALARDGVKHD